MSKTFDDYTVLPRQNWNDAEAVHKIKIAWGVHISETKITLSPYDDKRYIVPDSTDKLPWEHYKIPLYLDTYFLNKKKTHL